MAQTVLTDLASPPVSRTAVYAKGLNLSAICTGRLPPPQEISRVLFSVTGRVDPVAMVRSGG
jgi:hypothetical protein